MLMLQKKWTLKAADAELVNSLQQSLKIHPSLCRMLVQRGIDTFEKSKQFFRTSAEHLHDPFLMKDMHKAVERIHKAISQGEKVLIYGDYDVDGTTSVAVVYRFFKDLHPNLEFYIPHRFTEGYGVSKQGIDYAREAGFSLIITLDCGIKSTVLIAEAASYGIDVIVCDHHMPDDILPGAYAILNPKQPDCNYPYKELCGCGVGYKLISAYAKQYDIATDRVNQFLDLVATAIAADIVPITGENRTLCVLGLKKANEDPSIPLKALKQISNLDKAFTITDLVFIIAPRVNAAGRMDDARKAVELFLAEDDEAAKSLAEQLQENNNDRRDIDKSTTVEALEQIQEIYSDTALRSTVVYHPEWHKGVVGIVASRLIEHHYRPTIVLTLSNGKVTGSARSIKGFNLFEGLNHCAEYLDAYGGHYFAAGLTMSEEKLPAFRKRFDEVVKSMVAEELFQPEIEIDAEIDLSTITEAYLNVLRQFAPHGPDNMRPIFLTRNVRDYKGMSQIVKEKHIRFVVDQENGPSIQGIGFNMADKLNSVVKAKPTFDILYHIEENVWNGQTRIQMKVVDVM
ncbi:MAG: single-stranded-DNA-specific exonuclease RecJ [Chitinophagaceae bacterium]|nr:single-stranded-DNA-specific exonuclease RecJ [Chitinophagaceae bacterium]